MSKKPKLFAWDFHGTLEQGTDVGFTQILRVLSKEYLIVKRIELVEVRKLFGSSIMDFLHYFFPGFDDKTYNLMRSRIAEVQNQEHIARYIKPSPHATQVLKKIKSLGHKNIVVSNSHPRHIGHFLDAIGIGTLFDEIFAIDRHYSGIRFNPAAQKAKSIKSFADKNGIDKIIVIGDAQTDIEAGHKVGAITIQYIRTGFPKVKTRAHYKITDLRDVLKHI